MSTGFYTGLHMCCTLSLQNVLLDRRDPDNIKSSGGLAMKKIAWQLAGGNILLINVPADRESQFGRV